MTYLMALLEIQNYLRIRPLFSVVQNINSAANNLNSYLMEIRDRAFQWKISFNSDPKRQAQDFNKMDHPPLYFNQNLVELLSTQKYLEMVLDAKLEFSLYLKNVENKVNKTIRLLRIGLQNTLPRTLLITIFK